MDGDMFPRERPESVTLSRTRFEQGRDCEPSDARIGAQLEFMSDHLTNLRANINDLEEKISGILIPDFPSDAFENPNEVPRKMASDISNIIDDLNGSISSLQNKVVRIMDRVQL